MVEFSPKDSSVAELVAAVTQPPLPLRNAKHAKLRMFGNIHRYKQIICRSTLCRQGRPQTDTRLSWPSQDDFRYYQLGGGAQAAASEDTVYFETGYLQASQSHKQ